MFKITRTNMKYIITESKLNELVYKYLDNIKWSAEGSEDEFVVYGNNILMFDTYSGDNTLRINSEIIDILTKLFGTEDVGNYILNWFNNKFNIKLSDWEDTEYDTPPPVVEFEDDDYFIEESHHNKEITSSSEKLFIDKFISSQFEGFEEEFSPEYINLIFWIKNDNIIAEIDNQDRFWVKKEIWDAISRIFSLEHKEVQSYIKNWLEEHYNLGKLTPKYQHTPSFN